ncbi:MAG: hypothetical protein IRZ16_17855 [Myxococcaceae bacterium]|nr:hypothetical protein [Myxococcaceae bacterium]
MGVGGVRGGGGRGRAGGAKGAGAGRVSGTGFSGKVESAGGAGRTEGLVGPSSASGSANVGALGPVDPVTAHALELAMQLKSGQIASKEEATRRLVADILKEKLRMQSRALTSRIADALQDDPRLNQALERLWSKG